MTDARTLYDALRARLSQRPLVLLLDVDGTLSPIAPTPEAATVPEATRSALRRLVQAPGVHVALVSGRAARDARHLVAVDGVWAIGNHGFELIAPDGQESSDASLTQYRERIASAVRMIEDLLQGHPGTLLEDKRWTLSIHYRQAGAAVGEALRPELERIAAAAGLRLTAGKMVFELRPPVKVDKGTASRMLVDRLLGAAAGAVVYAGDDRTDEDAFAALRADGRSAVTIRIGRETSEAPIATAAEFVLADVEAMRAFLQYLAEDA